MIEKILDLVRIGYHVFPCSPVDKRPLTKNGFYAASIDENVVRGWWHKTPDALIGVACGRSGLVVVDIDDKDDRHGSQTWDAIKHDDITTVEQNTPSGGRQILLKADPSRPLKQGSDVNGYIGIDIRNAGGYIIVAPSVMCDGRKYEWLSDQSPFDIEPVAPPDWVFELFKDDAPSSKKSFSLPEKLNAGSRNDTLFRYACSLKSRNDMDQAQVLASVHTYNKMSCSPPLHSDEVYKIVKQAFNYKDSILPIVEGLEEIQDAEQKEMTSLPIEDSRIKLVSANDLKWDYRPLPKKDREDGMRPTLSNTFNNTRNVLQCRPELFDVFRYNEFSKDIDIVKYHPWLENSYVGKTLDDTELILLKDYFRRFGFTPTLATLDEAITKQAISNAYHPVKSYLRGLEWDGVDRLSSWLTVYGGASDNAYTRQVGRICLIAACQRINKPGCKFDYMVILEGRQGIGKSQLVGALGGEWYGEVNIMARDKDTIDKMRGKWIIEVPEMVSFKKQEVESLKAFLSNGVDRVRPAYARKAQDFPRQCVFICTINPDNTGYLKDHTGGRRFWPVFLNEIDLKGIRRDRDQLWAQAYHESKNQVKSYIEDEEAIEIMQQEQGGRQQHDDMEQEVDEYLKEEFVKNSSKKGVRSIDIFENVFNGTKDKFDRRVQNRIAVILFKLGWSRQSYRDEHGSVVKGYTPPESFNADVPKDVEWED